MTMVLYQQKTSPTRLKMFLLAKCFRNKMTLTNFKDSMTTLQFKSHNLQLFLRMFLILISKYFLKKAVIAHYKYIIRYSAVHSLHEIESAASSLIHSTIFMR